MYNTHTHKSWLAELNLTNGATATCKHNANNSTRFTGLVFFSFSK